MNIATSPVVGRIADLRNALAAHKIDALVVPSSDPHLSEYLPSRWQGRRWLSGFNGSVGTLIVTKDFAGLWADGRYWTQAGTELAGSGIELMKIPNVGSAAHVDWLAATLPPDSTVAVDGDVLGLGAARSLKGELAKRNIALRTDIDLVDKVWRDRPSLPVDPVYEHAAPHATVSRAEKLKMVRAEMTRLGADWHWVSTVDDIAWIFNLRGSDVKYNPVFMAHALIGKDGAALFLLEGKIDAALRDRLAADGVRVEAYDAAKDALSNLPTGGKLLIDPSRIAFGTMEAVKSGVQIVESINPSTLMKSRKTAAEADYVRATMAQDGAALCEFFSWLEGALASGERITELTIDEKITAARKRRPGFVGQSFGTIAGFNGNGAMPHYSASEKSHAVIEGDGLLLIDSGGQYLGGTTDITRVVKIGNITAEHKRDFTVVLKGMIQLTLAKFPRGAKSAALDTIARAPIWAMEADFSHGTGHGVGYFLNVHEGPQSISPAAAGAVHAVMEPGMITSNEPGLYRPGKWGVRIENLVLSVSAATNEFGEFLQFETLTLCPIDTRCVDVAMLDGRERNWLNGYHATVRERLQGLVEGPAREWLIRATEAV
jgi:Xaa-Pro aminopeptidase